jgi:hypothetical protein
MLKPIFGRVLGLDTANIHGSGPHLSPFKDLSSSSKSSGPETTEIDFDDERNILPHIENDPERTRTFYRPNSTDQSGGEELILQGRQPEFKGIIKTTEYSVR